MQDRQKNCGGSPSLSHDPNWLPPSLQSFEVLLSYSLGTWANIVRTTTFSVLCFIFFLLSNITCTEVLVSWFLQSSFNDVQFSSQRKLCLIRGSSHIFFGFWICFHERLYKYFPKYQAWQRKSMLSPEVKGWRKTTEQGLVRTQVQDGASPLLCYC